MDRARPQRPHEEIPDDARREPDLDDELDVDDSPASEPPFTNTRHMTSPKFGSAGSGGAELEPGPDR